MPVSTADPTSLPSGIDGEFYVREKSETEAPDAQHPEPFYYQTIDSGANNHYLQLGFRALVCFNGSSSNPVQADIKYSHNIALQSSTPKGIVRDSKGLYTINFLNYLPSDNFIVMGNGIRNSSDVAGNRDLGVYIQNATTVSNVKDSTFVKIMFKSNSGDLYDPLQGFIAIVGG
jgi:hypothetical protein